MGSFEAPRQSEAVQETPEKIQTFERYFKTGKLVELKRDELPKEALQYFEGMSGRFMKKEDHREGNFNHYYSIRHDDISGLITYIADQNRVYGYKRPPVLERNIYLFEVIDGQKVGHGELRFQPYAKEKDLYFKERPFVGYSGTENGYRGQGLGRKRLLVMHAYSQMEWNLPLYSGDQNETADHVWQSLLREGLAEEVHTGKSARRKRYKVTVE